MLDADRPDEGRLGELVETVAAIRARIPPVLTPAEAVAKRAAAWRAAAVRARRPWVTTATED